MTLWVVLLEDVDYNAEFIFNLGKKISLNNEHYNLFKEWSSNPKTDTRMMYSLDFLYGLETFLIKNGVLFDWIDDIGIRILPTKIDFSAILDDCLSMNEFAEHRNYMFIHEKKDEDGNSQKTGN